MTRFVALLCAVFALAIASSPSNAAPAYVGRVELTSDQNSIFYDDFASGKLDRWTAQTGAVLMPSRAFQSGYCLSIQGTRSSQASVSNEIMLDHPGIVELSALVWLPKLAEGQNGEVFKMYLHSGTNTGSPDRTDSVYLSADWEKTGYTINAHWVGPGSPGNVCAGTKNPVLNPQKWATLTLRLDTGSGRLAVLIDSVQKASTKVKPQDFTSIKSFALIRSPER